MKYRHNIHTTMSQKQAAQCHLFHVDFHYLRQILWTSRPRSLPECCMEKTQGSHSYVVSPTIRGFILFDTPSKRKAAENAVCGLFLLCVWVDVLDVILIQRNRRDPIHYFTVLHLHNTAYAFIHHCALTVRSSTQTCI